MIDSDLLKNLMDLMSFSEDYMIEMNIQHKYRLIALLSNVSINCDRLLELNNISNISDKLNEIHSNIDNGWMADDAGNVKLPISFCNEILDRLDDEIWSEPDFKWLVPSIDIGFLTACIIDRLKAGLSEWEPDEENRHRHILENMIYYCGSTKNISTLLLAVDEELKYNNNFFEGNFISDEFENWSNKIKFDVITCMPPTKSGNKVVWGEYIEKCFKLLKYKGTGVFITKTNWREPVGKYSFINKKINSLNIESLNLENSKKSHKVFGSKFPFDWYVFTNFKKLKNGLTKVKFQDGSIEMIDLSDVEFIPNSKMKEIQSLIANPGEEKVEVLYSRSAYGSDKGISKEKVGDFKYPVVYTCPASGKINFWWSNSNDKGHFGQPKVIWSNGSSPSIHVDSDGKYGLTQFAYAIVDKPENLPIIKKVLESKEFIQIMKACTLNGNHRYNRKVIALFRKDFWKDFI